MWGDDQRELWNWDFRGLIANKVFVGMSSWGMGREQKGVWELGGQGHEGFLFVSGVFVVLSILTDTFNKKTYFWI